MQQIWRLNIKPDASNGTDPRKFCFERSILGIGWAVHANSEIDWDIYYKLAEEEYYKKDDRGWWPAINAIKNRMQINDLCWTRDWNGVYYLGRITSDWAYRGDNEHLEADVVNIRECEWVKVGNVDAVPGKVVNSFIPNRTVQAVDNLSVSLYSQFQYNLLTKKKHYKIPAVSPDLFSLISPEDCEDIVGIFLQEKGYRIIPSSCKTDTAAYEFVLKHTNSGNSAVVQVKQQNEKLDVTGYSELQSEVYLLTTSGEYTGQLSTNIHCLDPNELKKFAYKKTQLMSERVKTWMKIIKQINGN